MSVKVFFTRAQSVPHFDWFYFFRPMKQTTMQCTEMYNDRSSSANAYSFLEYLYFSKFLLCIHQKEWMPFVAFWLTLNAHLGIPKKNRFGRVSRLHSEPYFRSALCLALGAPDCLRLSFFLASISCFNLVSFSPFDKMRQKVSKTALCVPSQYASTSLCHLL